MSSTKGDKSMIFTPKGLSVKDLILSIFALTTSLGALPPPIIPKPPALETAPAKSPSATQAIPPWKIGYLIFSNSVIRVCIIPSFYHCLSNSLILLKTSAFYTLTVKLLPKQEGVDKKSFKQTFSFHPGHLDFIESLLYLLFSFKH